VYDEKLENLKFLRCGGKMWGERKKCSIHEVGGNLKYK